MKINWLVRAKNKEFWLAVIPAVLLLIQTIAGLFCLNIDLGVISNKLIAMVNAVFVLLTILGVVNDPTTAGLSDSEQALIYQRPKASNGGDSSVDEGE